ncbi:hypothetical protein LMG31506_02270 [Cupriavidus yeoncheonensis]|uniref:Iron ABC transporter permease n=1 Tax=Cupriavidus yeoncheonensis TaxID=1462994 RepID=A0A916IT13_9BURK|nr:hypothetical protein LMG31506_02270 [Cupriavidus yeoncheonensis]
MVGASGAGERDSVDHCPVRVAVGIALAIGYAGRAANARRGWLVRALTRLCGMGYALPGSVIAVGVLVPVAWLDNALSSWLQQQFGMAAGLLLTGGSPRWSTPCSCVSWAWRCRLSMPGSARSRPAWDAAARSLGHGPGATLRRVHFPMLRGSLLTAGLIVFVDVMKELPATFVMRPFNFDTLAVQAYNLASDERLTEAATASLVIVAVGLLPVVLLSRTIRRGADS